MSWFSEEITFPFERDCLHYWKSFKYLVLILFSAAMDILSYLCVVKSTSMHITWKRPKILWFFSRTEKSFQHFSFYPTECKISCYLKIKETTLFFKDHPEKLPPTRKYTNSYKIFNCEGAKIPLDHDLLQTPTVQNNSCDTQCLSSAILFRSVHYIWIIRRTRTTSLSHQWLIIRSFNSKLQWTSPTISEKR